MFFQSGDTAVAMDKPLLVADGGENGIAHSHISAAALVELAELRSALRRLRLGVWLLAGCGICGASALWYSGLPPERREEARGQALLASIPVVALFFTWFHIWLAIQMMFLPLRFLGIWQYKNTGLGIGWQGVVPRKSHKMAKTAYACASPYLLRVRDWLAAVSPDELVALLRPRIHGIVSSAVESVCQRHFPGIERRLPASVRQELAEAAVEKIEDSFAELWKEFAELLCDERIGIDNDGMVVTAMTENKDLLNHFFMQLGAREFRFIEHCGAALGFFCGVIQLFAFTHLEPGGRAILLPLTGFFLGIFTNWLAILVCFKPIFPHPIHIFGWYICNVQGLFLKRQKEVAVQYSKMLCDHFFDFPKVIAYLRNQPELWGKLRAAYLQHNARVFNQALGSSVTCFGPLAVGKRQFKAVEDDLMETLVARFGEADEMHQMAGNFIAIATDIFRINSVAMQNMPPDKFENLLHPIFKEDEWILVLLGGVLGAIVGIAQVHFLSN